MPQFVPEEPERLPDCDLQLAPGTVYISHAYENRNAARRIADALEAAGVSVWCTEFGGTPLLREARAQKAVEQCALFLPLISQQTENRIDGFFRREWKFAVSGRAPIVPTLVDPMKPRVDRDVLYLRHYDVHVVPFHFLNLATTNCPSGANIGRVRELGETSSQRMIAARMISQTRRTRKPEVGGRRSASFAEATACERGCWGGQAVKEAFGTHRA